MQFYLELEIVTKGAKNLNTSTIIFSSVTYALKAKKVLKRIGINVKLIKTDSNKTNYGCTYGVKIPTKNFYDVIAELKKENIDYTLLGNDIY